MGKYITAVDFGTSKTAIAVGEGSSSGVRIVAYSEARSKGINRGDVLNIKAVKNTLTALVNDVEEQMHDIKDHFRVRKLYAGISGSNIRCEKTTVTRTREDPDRTIEQIEVDSMLADAYKSFKSDSEVVLHVIPQYYNIDDIRALNDIEGHQGKEVMGFYTMFIGRTKSAEHTKSVINKAGYQVGKLVLEPLASARGVLTDEEMELGAAMVDIGGGTTDLLIYKDNNIRYSAVIPFGGDSITQDIRQMCNVTELHAEMMKRKHGSCLSSLGADNKFIGITDDRGIVTRRIPFRQLFETIEARTEEIIATVKSEIAAAGMEDKISKIVLTGGTANLNQIAVLFRQMTGYMVRLAIPNEKRILGSSVPEIFKHESSTVAGLVLKGFDYEQDDEKEEEVVRSTKSFAAPDSMTAESSMEEKEDDGDDNTQTEQRRNFFTLFKSHDRVREHRTNADTGNVRSQSGSGSPSSGRHPAKQIKKNIEKTLFDDFFSDTDDEA